MSKCRSRCFTNTLKRLDNEREKEEIEWGRGERERERERERLISTEAMMELVCSAARKGCGRIFINSMVP